MRAKEIFEVEIGGGIELNDFPDNLPNQDLSSDQLDLFEPNTTGDPRLPYNLKLKGRMGEFYVAERLPKVGEEKSSSKCFVWIHSGKAVAYVWLTTYSKENMNYPTDIYHKPELNGIGYRVSAVFVDPEYRGKALGPSIYEWLLKNVCDYLMADSLQTMGGVKLWKKLKSMKQFSVQVWDSERYMSRARRAGKDFNHVYNTSHLIPWVTLKSKLNFVLDDPE